MKTHKTKYFRSLIAKILYAYLIMFALCLLNIVKWDKLLLPQLHIGLLVIATFSVYLNIRFDKANRYDGMRNTDKKSIP